MSVSGGPSTLQKISAQTSDAYSDLYGRHFRAAHHVATLGNDGYACTALPAYSLYNSYALIERGASTNANCTFNLKATNAVNAGAIGIVFYMADSTAPIAPELQDDQGDAPPLFGPVVMIANSDGVALKTYLASHAGATVQIDPAGTETSLTAYNAEFGFSPPLAGNQLIGFSSVGPDPGDFSIKPDIVATAGGDQSNPYNSPDPNDFYFFGQSGMYLAAQSYDPTGEVYSPTRYGAFDGTSFAAPLVAGTAAMVWQAHPTYTAAQVRSALINSSAQDTTIDDTGFPVNAVEIGAGRLDAGGAVSSNVAASPVSVSFGNLKAGATLPISKALSLTNLGSASVNLTIAVSAPTDVNGTAATGAAVAADKTTLTLAAGASGTVNLSLSGTVPAADQYAGVVTVTGGAVPLHIPYIVLVGTGTIYDMVPVQYGQTATFYGCFEGLAGEDVGPVGIRLVDSSGVPVVGSPVTFTVSPRSSVTLQSVAGEPACSPASSGTTTKCNTDAYGIAYAEVIDGSSLTSSPSITASAGGMTFTFGGQACGQVIAQPTITSISEGAAFVTNIAPGSYMSRVCRRSAASKLRSPRSTGRTSSRRASASRRIPIEPS